MKLKEIKEYVRLGAAVDIGSFSFNQMQDFLHGHNLEKVGTSHGVYGINGGLLRDLETGKLYAITARNSALFMAF